MKRIPHDDDSIDSDELPDQSSDGEESENEDDFDNLYVETPEQKKVRLAKEYLAQIKKEESDDSDAVNERLTTDYSIETGKKFTPIILKATNTQTERFRAHDKGRPTAFALSNGLFYSAAKDGSIVRCSFNPRHKLDISPPSETSILCLAYDANRGKLASGSLNGIVTIWDPDNGGPLAEMKGHKGPVTGVCFQSKTVNIQSVTQSFLLFSCSYDATVRVWDVDTGTCLSTLYGHNMEVLGMDFIGNAITVGADHTLRLWKYELEKQLVYHGGNIRGPIDCCSMFNSEYCVTGSQDGRICLWNIHKKKPISVQANAHGEGNWILSLATYRYHKFFASGSHDGKIKFWKITDDNKIEFLFDFPLIGYANDMHFSEDGSFLAVLVSQELRLGRWLPRIQAARQGVHKIDLEKIK